MTRILNDSAFLPHSPARNANRLDDADHDLRHEDEEEGHEVERAVGPAQRWTASVRGDAVHPTNNNHLREEERGLSLEGFVNGPEPAHVGAGGEEDEPQDGHAEVGRAAASTHPRQAADEINGQSGGVHCQHRKKRDRWWPKHDTHKKTCYRLRSSWRRWMNHMDLGNYSTHFHFYLWAILVLMIKTRETIYSAQTLHTLSTPPEGGNKSPCIPPDLHFLLSNGKT